MATKVSRIGNPSDIPGTTRRGIFGAAAGLVAAPVLADAGGSKTESDGASVAALVELNVNGALRRVTLDPRTTLLDALRDHLNLTGSKKGCDQGQCGACTVHVDGRRILSCLTLAIAVQGRKVTTIEGVHGAGGGLHPMQAAFIAHDGFQCGYCTPGQIMSAIACVNEGHARTPGEIREYMSGNLCRCAAYPNIVKAIEQARDGMKAA
jgi:xanthine dehydrogenase YagT iron-sulfur-binding subunit